LFNLRSKPKGIWFGYLHHPLGSVPALSDFGLMEIALLVISMLETFFQASFRVALIQKKGVGTPS
jgi:hypothetical protein